MQNTLKTLRNFQSDRFFIVSLYLSLTPQERATRPPMYQTRLKTMQNQLRHWLADHPMEPSQRESMENDFKRMMDFIDEPTNLLGENSLPVRGLALFSCSAEGLFEAVRLPYVERNTLVVDRTPYIRRLFAVEADFGVNLVGVLDHRDAHFYQVDIHGIRELESLRLVRDREILPPGVHGVRTPSGMRALHGMGERNVQMLKQHEQQQHLRHIAETLLQLRRTHPYDRLLIAAPDDLANALPSYLHDYVRRTFAGVIAAHDKMPLNLLYERVLDKLMELDREQENRLLQEFRESIPHLALSGIEPVLKALEWGNVRVLLYDTDYTLPGCVYYPSGLLGLHPEHAPEGTELIWRLPDIVDTVVERALDQGAQVEAIHAPSAKSEIHGLSAILRYPMSQTATSE